VTKERSSYPDRDSQPAEGRITRAAENLVCTIDAARPADLVGGSKASTDYLYEA
jgi:hypothetical protein